MHIRAQIRAALTAALSGLATPVTIEAERRRRLDLPMMPAVLYYLTDSEETAAGRTMGSPTYGVESDQVLLIECHAVADTGAAVADILDQLQAEVEAALAADLTLGGIVEIVHPVSSSLEMSDSQDRIQGTRSIVYNVPYRYQFGDPETPET